MKKIAIIGANGRIGQEVLKNICNSVNNDEIEIVLLVSNKETSLNKMKGFLLDLENSLFLISNKVKDIKFLITQDYKLIQNADVIIITASKSATPEEEEEFKKFDNTGRLITCKVNLDMIKDIGENIKKYASNSFVVVITNQVDIITSIMRSILGKTQKVIGIGNSLDSARLCYCLYNALKDKFTFLKKTDIQAKIVGYHYNSMFILNSTLKTNIKEVDDFLSSDEGKKVIESCLQETRDMGMHISILNKLGSEIPLKVYGSFVAPSKAISDIVLAYIGEKDELETVCNILVDNEDVANLYGIKMYDEISIPVVISKSNIKPITKYVISDYEKDLFKEAQTDLQKDIEILKRF